MRRIFVFTAGDKAARSHLSDSITKPVSLQWLLETTPTDMADYMAEVIAVDDGFYAWGAVPGPVNEKTWERMQVGDQVLCVYDNRYRFACSVTAKFRNAELAKRIWKTDPEGRTWEYMYSLSRPVPIDVSVVDGAAPQFLNKGYRGFTRISDDKVRAIVGEFGSLDGFMESVFGVSIPATSVEAALTAAREAVAQLPQADFDPSSLVDGRRRVVQEVVRRQGQPAFRKSLLAAYGGTCVVTGCSVESVLEAAHIAPYLGLESNKIQNGLLMRADIHTLFDLGLLKITTAGVVELHDTLASTDYTALAGRQIAEPIDPAMRPSVEALRHKYSMVL